MYSLYKQLHMGRRLHRRQKLLRMLVKTIFNRGHLVLYGIVLSIEYFVSKFRIRHSFELLHTENNANVIAFSKGKIISQNLYLSDIHFEFFICTIHRMRLFILDHVFYQPRYTCRFHNVAYLKEVRSIA